MKAKLAKAVRAQFELQMSKRLPDFKISARQRDLYMLKVSQDLVFFVYLSITDSRDSFALEIAANQSQEFPWTEMPGSLRDVAARLSETVWRFRVSKLWGELKPHAWTLGKVRDHRQILEDIHNKEYLAQESVATKLEEVEPKVRDAIDKLCDYGIPYFESSAEKHGYKMKIEIGSAWRTDK